MSSRYEVELTVTSAKDLKNVNWRHGPLKPYAVAWVDPKNKCSTRVDDEGDAFPQWDHKLTIAFDTPIEDSTLHVDIVHAGAKEDVKPLIGFARLPLREIVDDVGFNSRADRKLDLKRPSGRPHGKLNLSVSLRDVSRYRAPEPYYAPPYGVPPPQTGGTRDYYAPPSYAGNYGAPPAPYGAPPQTAYAAPPSGYPAYGVAPPPTYAAQPSGGYDSNYYGQQQQGYYGGEEKKKSKFGGMGTGLAVGAVAGVLGGLALAEGVDAIEDKIADDAAERVEDDYGGDDGGDW